MKFPYLPCSPEKYTSPQGIQFESFNLTQILEEWISTPKRISRNIRYQNAYISFPAKLCNSNTFKRILFSIESKTLFMVLWIKRNFMAYNYWSTWNMLCILRIFFSTTTKGTLASHWSINPWSVMRKMWMLRVNFGYVIGILIAMHHKILIWDCIWIFTYHITKNTFQECQLFTAIYVAMDSMLRFQLELCRKWFFVEQIDDYSEKTLPIENQKMVKSNSLQKLSNLQIIWRIWMKQFEDTERKIERRKAFNNNAIFSLNSKRIVQTSSMNFECSPSLPHIITFIKR